MRIDAEKSQALLGKLFVLFIFFVLVPVIGDFHAYSQGKRQPQPEFRLPTQPSSESNSPTVLIVPGEDYRIGPGDVIDIHVEDAPEISRTLRVTAAGTFSMPFIGQVTAQQKTTEELSNHIIERLRGQYLMEPNVTIQVKQINSHSFFIQGAVGRPGVYQIEGRPSLLKLITVAGGLASNYGSTAYVIREVSPQRARSQETEPATHPPPSNIGAEDNTKYNLTKVNEATESTAKRQAEEETSYEMKKVKINGLLRGHFEQNMILEPGSIVNIPYTDVFFVAGEVKGPGSFPLKEGTTLRQAISLAQGTTFEADKGSGIIFRDDPASGNRKEIKVNIGSVMSGKKDDVEIMANDIIIIPNSRLKSVSSALLTAFGMSAVRVPGRY